MCFLYLFMLIRSPAWSNMNKQTQFARPRREDEQHGLKSIVQSLRLQRLNKANLLVLSIAYHILRTGIRETKPICSISL